MININSDTTEFTYVSLFLTTVACKLYGDICRRIKRWSNYLSTRGLRGKGNKHLLEFIFSVLTLCVDFDIPKKRGT